MCASTLALALVATSTLVASSASAQTITGTLIDGESRQPIPLGLVMMYTEAGDSITATVSDERGRFRVASPEPGSFILRAAALGYREAPAGVFELGVDGSMTVEYRLAPAPIPIEALLVSIDRPVFDHHLVRNGFVRRFQRGFGRFITPHDIEESPARSTEDLLAGIPQVRVAAVVVPVGGLGIPSSFIGETVQIASPVGGYCNPTVYVDGHRVHYEPSAGFTLSQYASIGDIDAVEIYRRPAEIPVEFGVADQGRAAPGVGIRQGPSGCGVLVLWTKQGLAVGQRAEGWTASYEPEATTLPSVRTTGEQPTEGERVRVQLDLETARALDASPIFEGDLVMAGPRALVVNDPMTGQPRSLPLEGIDAVQVRRLKGPGDAYKRGAVAGAIFGVGMAAFLSTMCKFSCGEESSEPVALPSIGVGLFVGVLVWSRGPGHHWVSAPVPDAPSGPGGVSFGFAIPSR